VKLLVLGCVVLLGLALLVTGIGKLMQGHVAIGVVLVAVGVLMAGFILPALRSALRWLQAILQR
jgi:hypothetical protein